MTRKKILAIAAAFGLCSAIATQVNAVVPVTTPSATLNVTGINKPIDSLMQIDRHVQAVTAYIEGFAMEHFRSRSVQTKAVDIELFAGPHQLFASERKPSLADSSAGGMILASLGLMALIVRRRIGM